MRQALMATLVVATVHAASIRGVVVDNETGRPLAHAAVVAQPIAGTSGVPYSARTGLNGVFELSGLTSGAWLLTASRRGFAPTQLRLPVSVAADSESALTFRLRRFAAISGTVLDENDVGMQEQEVVAYRNARPLSIAARATSGDRGMYRLEGLEPGTYLVRTTARDSDEESYLPTFTREAQFYQEARTVSVRYDEEIPLIDIRPIPGRLVTLIGHVNGPAPAVVTLVSDAGRLTATAEKNGRFRFPAIAPAAYEIYAQAQRQAAWRRVEVYTNMSDVRLDLAPFPELRVTVEDYAGNAIDPSSVPILIRHRDLAGEAKSELLGQLQGAGLPPGRWELTLAPTPSWYAVTPIGWSETIVTAPGPVVAKVVLSNRPATLRGIVRNAAREPVAGVPVYLGDLRTMPTDIEGRFEFYGLAPGAYRLLATFDGQSLTDANSIRIEVEEGQERSIDLDLRNAP
jgi:carboxypeptidase family protein